MSRLPSWCTTVLLMARSKKRNRLQVQRRVPTLARWETFKRRLARPWIVAIVACIGLVVAILAAGFDWLLFVQSGEQQRQSQHQKTQDSLLHGSNRSGLREPALQWLFDNGYSLQGVTLDCPDLLHDDHELLGPRCTVPFNLNGISLRRAPDQSEPAIGQTTIRDAFVNSWTTDGLRLENVTFDHVSMLGGEHTQCDLVAVSITNSLISGTSFTDCNALYLDLTGSTILALEWVGAVPLGINVSGARFCDYSDCLPGLTALADVLWYFEDDPPEDLARWPEELRPRFVCPAYWKQVTLVGERAFLAAAFDCMPGYNSFSPGRDHGIN